MFYPWDYSADAGSCYFKANMLFFLQDDSACDSSDQIAELLAIPGRALDKAEVLLDKAEDLARRVWEAGWEVVHHRHLPKWLRDNDFLVEGHRPPLNSFKACIKSIFRVHTETGNIWTHMLGKSLTNMRRNYNKEKNNMNHISLKINEFGGEMFVYNLLLFEVHLCLF